MSKILILGGNARETVFAIKLANDGNEVHIMSEFKNINLINNAYIKHYAYYFNEDIIKDINPDFVFAFNESYIFDKNLNEKTHNILPHTCKICIPYTNAIFLEKDKLKTKKLLQKNIKHKMIRVFNEVQMSQLINKYKKVFVRNLIGDDIQFYIFSELNIGDNLDYDNSIVLAEPYILGENATITYFINNGKFSILPIVFDYPYFLDNNNFVKTSGIMCEYDYYKTNEYNLMNIANELIEYVKAIIPSNYTGFLATQILVTKSDYSFVEFDIKPGEPEFINIINAMEDNFGTILNNTKSIYIPKIKKDYSISVALASSDYPKKAFCQLELIDELFNNTELEFYYSKAILKNNALQNFENGRLGFIYKEGINYSDVLAQLKNIKEDTKKFLEDSHCCLYLANRTTKYLIQ